MKKEVILTNDNTFNTSAVILTNFEGTIDRIVLHQEDNITGKEAKIVLTEEEIYEITENILKDEQNNLSLAKLYNFICSLGYSGIITKIFIFNHLLLRLDSFEKMQYQEQMAIIEDIYYDWINNPLDLLEIIKNKVDEIVNGISEDDEDYYESDE